MNPNRTPTRTPNNQPQKECWPVAVAWRQTEYRQAVHQIMGKSKIFPTSTRTLKSPT